MSYMVTIVVPSTSSTSNQHHHPQPNDRFCLWRWCTAQPLTSFRHISENILPNHPEELSAHFIFYLFHLLPMMVTFTMAMERIFPLVTWWCSLKCPVFTVDKTSSSVSGSGFILSRTASVLCSLRMVFLMLEFFAAVPLLISKIHRRNGRLWGQSNQHFRFRQNIRIIPHILPD